MDSVNIVALLSIFVGMPWVIFSGIAKIKAASASEGENMRKSELEAIIQDAVNEAVEPFRRRIETLEAITVDEDDGQRRLDAAVLADALEPNAGSEDPAAVRRRART